MKAFFKIFILSVLLWNCTAARQKQGEVKIYTAEDFFQLPQQTEYKISPDGQYLAYVGAANSRVNIFIRKIGQPQAEPLTDTEREFHSFSWGSKDYILYLQDDAGDENYKLYRINIHNKEIKCLTDYKNVKTEIIDLLQTQDENILVKMNLRDPELFDPYRLNIITGQLELLYKNQGDINGWLADNSGKLRVAIAKDVLYRKDNQSEFRKVIDLGPDEIFDPRYFASDNDHVYAYSNIGRDKIAIVEFDLDEGKEVKVLFEHPFYDAFGDDERDFFIYSQRKGRLLYARYTAEKRKMVFFDTEMERIYQKVKRIIGENYEINFTSSSDDLSRFVLHVSSDRLEGIYFSYDDQTGVLEEIHRVSPWLDEKEMAVMKPISFKARDGLVIHGYLTLPKGLKPEGLPVVVNPHAGPQWRNSWIFDLKTQFLANRGYAVLQVNFRGSEGYGKTFMRSGFKQLGLKIQDDITDGVYWLIDQGIADKNRIAIFGWSFGGYAALAGVTFTPDLYACGIDLWGISNFFTSFRSFPAYWKPYLEEIKRRWGDIDKDSVQMYQTSPVFHVDQIKAALLIFQGANDVRVKVSQSGEMVEELRKHNKEVEYILIEGEGHGITDEKKIIDQAKIIENFLARHLGRR